jgi:hypothetical protein
MKEAFDIIFDQKMAILPSRLFTDQGKEFESPSMLNYFKEERFIDKHASSDKSVKAGVAERMIRTIKHRCKKFEDILIYI